MKFREMETTKKIQHSNETKMKKGKKDLTLTKMKQDRYALTVR